MDWTKKSWEIEDQLYAPKREVNNRKSKYITHLMGHLHSHKMNRRVGYESLWGECLFYYLLELDRMTIRYYEQSVVVPIRVRDIELEVTEWDHVSDVLVFKQGNVPFLFQLKGGNYTEAEQKAVRFCCQLHAQNQGWKYATVFPKELPKIVKYNIQFLWHYLRPRHYYSSWEEEVLRKLTYLQPVMIETLAKSFSAKIDFRYILPLIYHLIGKGCIETDLFKLIDANSTVRAGSLHNAIFQQFHLEGDTFESL